MTLFLYHALSTLGIVMPLGVCAWTMVPFARFVFPAFVTRSWQHKRHDGLMAAVWLLMLNRAWLGGRHIIFGSRLSEMEAWELPYLNAALAWALFSIVALILVLRGYRQQQ